MSLTVTMSLTHEMLLVGVHRERERTRAHARERKMDHNGTGRGAIQIPFFPIQTLQSQKMR
jgi:hypothetical protein